MCFVFVSDFLLLQGTEIIQTETAQYKKPSHNWDFQTGSTATGHKQHVGKLQAFCACSVQ